MIRVATAAYGWRDDNPSRAASIEWFNRWVETWHAEIRQRILDYAEEDCRATRIPLDGIKGWLTTARKIVVSRQF